MVTSLYTPDFLDIVIPNKQVLISFNINII